MSLFQITQAEWNGLVEKTKRIAFERDGMNTTELRELVKTMRSYMPSPAECDGVANTLEHAAYEIDRLRIEAVAADIRIINDAQTIARLEAERAALAAQEPVMIYEGRGIIDCGDAGHLDVTMLKMIAAGSKLYAAAGAAPKEKT